LQSFVFLVNSRCSLFNAGVETTSYCKRTRSFCRVPL